MLRSFRSVIFSVSAGFCCGAGGLCGGVAGAAAAAGDTGGAAAGAGVAVVSGCDAVTVASGCDASGASLDGWESEGVEPLAWRAEGERFW